MNNYYNNMEFNKILQMLADNALSEGAKTRALGLEPYKEIKLCESKLRETSEAKEIIELLGTPPLSIMKDLKSILKLAAGGGMLSPDDLTEVAMFLSAAARMKRYLKQAEPTGFGLALYGNGINPMDDVLDKINSAIRNGRVDDCASPELHSIRLKIEKRKSDAKSKLEDILRSKKECFADSYIVIRQGRSVLPVKKEHKSKIKGSVIDKSSSGGTLFMEPDSVTKISNEIDLLILDEENEVIKILYTLSDEVARNAAFFQRNMEYMDELDFVFAKGKLAIDMSAGLVNISNERTVRITEGRHPLLDRESSVPLNLELSDKVRGIIITGPNTGGKTVAIKTTGLLSLMVQSGLLVPADESSIFSMNMNVLSDIGDGQNINANLSTFSAHITNIIDILAKATNRSLILLDELGSGTDPKEGMGIAISIIEELLDIGCLFLVTSHYSEVKDYAAKTEGIVNARMEFDRESLRPTYKLTVGEAGESCALYISEKYGLPKHILQSAYRAAYNTDYTTEPIKKPRRRKIEIKEKKQIQQEIFFETGDSVTIYPEKENGIIYKPQNEKGDYIVQIKGQKKIINQKRIKLLIPAKDLYPADYDFSIIFDSVQNRKLRHEMQKRHVEGEIVLD